MLSRLYNQLRISVLGAVPLSSMAPNVTLPAPTVPTSIAARQNLPSTSSSETATFATGCFWGTEHIFRKYFDGKGLISAKVGYTGGNAKDPNYKLVCSGETGHAEAVRLEFDPSKIPYAELVEFFYRSHDPTTLNRQGGDVGTQYRSAIFYHTPEQSEIAHKVTKEVQEKHFAPKGQKIATQIVEAREWWDAEDYHQEYLDKNPWGYQCSTHRIWF